MRLAAARHASRLPCIMRMAIGRVLQEEIQEAVEALRAGELVAFPTETVYGLGANANNPDAVRKIFRAQGPPLDAPGDRAHRSSALPAALGARHAAGGEEARRRVLARSADAGGEARAGGQRRDHRRPGHGRDPRAESSGRAAAAQRFRRRHRRAVAPIATGTSARRAPSMCARNSATS